MKKLFFPLFSILVFSSEAQTSAVLTVNATSNISEISPLIYGKNNCLSDDTKNPISDATWQFYQDAGLRFTRENGGNNSTKYNWRKKLSSHPDWFNNVYTHDWDYSANTLLSKSPSMQGLYALQLLGKVASAKTHNFNDWSWSQGGSTGGGTGDNWAGGGGPTAYGGNNGVGNPALYLEDWPADSTVGILDHWFKDLKYDATRLQYWNMDNEPEIWQGTHDDIASSSITAEDYIQKYIAVAKAARLKFPNIKLVGPVSPNEWQWYTWNNEKVKAADNKYYSWMEYFVKRIAEEQTKSGMRLLDVLDVHFYPGSASDPTLTLQLHRIWFDQAWDYSGANGVKVDGLNSWNGGNTKEYFFERCNSWLTKYMGAQHQVKFAVSEYGATANSGSENPNVVACWYASHLGVFANKGIAFFTPWDWYVGQWEVLHLFSKKFGAYATSATSSAESVVSAYSSLSADGDSLMVAIVNRDQNNSTSLELNIQNFVYSDSTVNGYQLVNLPNKETFLSEANNALQTKQYAISKNKITFSVPKLSVTIIQIPTKKAINTPHGIEDVSAVEVLIYPNPSSALLQVQLAHEGVCVLSIFDVLGQKMGEWSIVNKQDLDLSSYASGNYFVQVRTSEGVLVKKIVKQ